MSTDINIRRTSRTVVDRAKEQQQAARAARLTQESTAKQTQENRDRILSDARTSAATRAALSNAPQSSFVIPSPNVLPFRRPEPAATRAANDPPYFILIAQNNEDFEWHDDIRLKVGNVTGEYIMRFPRKSSANAFPPGGNIYMFLPARYDLATFQQTAAWQTLQNARLAPDFGPEIVIQNVRAVTPVEPFTREIKKLQQAAEIPPVLTSISLLNVLAKSGDFGYSSYSGRLIFGYTNKRQYTILEYGNFAGANTVSSAAWGSSELTMYYPDDYIGAVEAGNETYFPFTNPSFYQIE
jgi:hypothetical protein